MNFDKIKFMMVVSAMFAIIMLTANTASAITSTTTGGNWNVGTTWVGGVPPNDTTGADPVIISTGATVTVPAAYAAKCTTINFTTTAGAVTSLNLADSGSSLTASSTVTIQQQGATGNANQINVGAGTFSAASVALQGASIGSRFTQILISTGTVTVTGNITSAGTDSRITFSDAGTLNIGGNLLSGTAGTFTASTGTVNFNANAAQTTGAYTFFNLILSGTNAKTTTGARVNGTLTMRGTATASAAITYGANAGLIYDTATARTTSSNEWTATFSGTGGVTIANTGAITLNGNKTLNTNVSLTINPGATLTTNNRTLTLRGNFTNSGTFNGGSSSIILTGTALTQSIDGFTTTGTVSMTKTAGTATFQGNVNGGGLTISGAGGTLDLGTGLTHTFTGTWTRTNGTLNGGSSLLKIGLSVSGTGGTFTASTGTVEWNRSNTQNIAGVVYNNLTLSGTSAKTIPAGSTVNGILSMEGTATASAAPTYGPNATLRYNTVTARNAGVEWINTFAAGAGGVIIDNTGTITLNASKVLNASVPLTTIAGASLNTSTWNLSVGGNLDNGGTFTGGAGIVGVTGTLTNSGTFNAGAGTITAGSLTNSNDFNASGILNVTGTLLNSAGTFTGGTGAISAATLTNNATLNTNSVAVNVTGNFSNTSTFTANASAIGVNGNWDNSGAFSAGTSTVSFAGAGTSTITGDTTFNNLQNTVGAKTVQVAAGTTLAVVGTLTNQGIFNDSDPITIGVNISNIGTYNAGAGTIGVTGSLTNGGTFNAGAGTITAGSLTNSNDFNASGILNVTGTLLNSAGTFTGGTGAISAATLTNNATFNTNSAAVNVSGNFVNTSGFTAGGSTITVSGNWTNSGGTFNAGTSTVAFAGVGTSTITGATTFKNLQNTVAGKTVQVAAGTTLTVGGNLDNQGTFNDSDPISITGNLVNSNTYNGGAGTIGVTGSVTNSGTFNAGAGTITAGSLTNSNDFNASGILNVTGTLLNSAGTFTGGTGAISAATLTNNASFNTNSVAVNVSGNFSNTSTFTANASAIGVNGNWDNSGAFSAGTSTVTFAGAGTSTITGATTFNNLQNTVVGKTVQVAAGTTLAVGGNLTNQGIFNDADPIIIGVNLSNIGTYNADAGTIGVTGSLTNSGTFNAGAGTITAGSLTNSNAFNASGILNVTGTLLNSAGTFTGGTGSIGVGGDLTNNGTFDTNSAAINITGNFINTTTFSAGASTITLNGNWTNTGGTFNAQTSTVVFAGSGASIVTGATTFNNLTLSGSGVKTIAVATVDGILSMEGTATASAAPTYGAAATLRYNTATARIAGVEWITPFAGTGGVIIDNTGTITLNADKVLNPSVPLTTIAGATLTASTFSLSIGGDFYNGGTFTGGAGTVGVTGTLTNSATGIFNAGAGTITAGNLTNNGTFNTNSVVVNVSGNFSNTSIFTANASAIGVNGNWDNSGAFSAGTSTVTFAGAGTSTITGSTTFNNLQNTVGGKTVQVAAGTTLAVGGNLTNQGIFNDADPITIGVNLSNTGTYNAGAGTIGVTGSLTNSGTFNAGAGTITAGTLTNSSAFNASGILNVTGTLLNSAGTFTGGTGAISAAALTNNATFNTNSAAVNVSGNFVNTSGFTAGGSTITVSGDWTNSGGTFNAQTSTVVFAGSGASVVTGATTFNNLTLSGSNAKTITAATVNGILSMEGTATASAAPTYGPAAALRYNTATARIAGVEWITPFAGTGGVIIDNIGAITLNADKVLNASVPLTTIAGATLNASTFSLTIGGDFNNGGTFTGGAGTIGVTGSLTNSATGTFNAGAGTITIGTNCTNSNIFNASGIIAITGNLLNSAGTFTGGTGAIGVGGNLTNNGTFNTSSVAVNVAGSFSNTSIFTANASAIGVNGNWGNSGTFTPGTSTVTFAGAGTTAVTGDTTFNNFSCSTASKAFTFATGSTQTVLGLLTINGSAFGTRISFASSGGAGTTWNLVLNGRYDCRYIAVQGSTASGTAYLPINPVGFKDNGNNTNWYDPNLPAEMLFYDNFETSTLAAAPPNKASSNWTITGANWLTQASTTVNTQNHTSGGTKSAYSSGGTAGQGIGLWNNPLWGPATNCTAEAWFYDDMQNPKKQWCFIDNAAGAQGVGVMIDTTRSTTKYVYCIYIGGDNRYVSYIDRALGWHRIQWVYTASANVELYLDGALLATTGGLSDFSDYDTGTWNWDNTAGSTAMWFDDFIVSRSQNQSRYRWYGNDSAETPTAIAAENTAITGRNVGTITRLRLQVQNNQYETWAGAYVTAQYRKGTSGTWDTLSPSADWNYADGLGTDKAQVANALLTNTNVREQFVESIPSAANLAMTTSQYGEWDFCVNSTGNATLGTVYYFRLVVTDSAGIYQRSLAAYDYYPQCTLTSPTLKQWLGTVDNNWNNANNWGPAGVPANTSDVIIMATAARDCRVNAAGAVCKSMVVQAGRALLLDTAATDLTVTQDMTVFGTITHSNNTAVLNLNGGNMRIDTAGRYNHSGNGALNASTATIQVINGGQYNVSGAPAIAAHALNMAVGGLVSVAGPATLNLQNFTIDLNGQWLSSNASNIVNISGSFINNGSMLGSTGGVFNVSNVTGTMSGTSTSTTFYQLSITGGITNNITNDVRVLNNFSVASAKSFAASSGNLYVGGNWTNAGTFSHGSGTLILNGAALQSVTPGGSDFNRLTVTNASVAGVSFADAFSTAYFTNTTANSLMTFASGRIYTISAAGGMNFQGTAGQLVKLRSGTPGSIWFIRPSGGGWSANYLDVRDSVDIVQQTIFPTNSTDSGNNTNWFTAGQDSNNNDIPDWWEYYYYGSLVGLTALTDTDGDGVINLFEYLIETDPRSAASPQLIYVDDNGGYNGDGTIGNPYKYLDVALNNAGNNKEIILAEGTYTLSNYSLNKKVMIKGLSARKTIITGPSPLGTSSNVGQMIDVAGTNRFVLSGVTIRNYRDDQPLITYGISSSSDTALNNVIMTGNNTQTKALIAPSGSSGSSNFYMFNVLAYGNTASAVVNAAGSNAQIINNTIVNNTATGILLNTTSSVTVENNIIRANLSQITNSASGTVTVHYCNVQGGYAGVGNYDSAETYIDAAKGLYRILPGTPAENAGVTTAVLWDLEWVTRPQGVAPDVGAYEIPATDNDNDGRTNAQETSAGTNLNNPDSDNDGLYDGEEVTYGTNPLNSDTDGDLVIDGQEPPIGMNPAVFDGQILVGIYYESFESQLQYPVSPVSVGGTGPWSGTIWGANTKYYGNIQVQYVGPPPAAYEGNKIINFKGQIFPRSYNISFIERNSLPQWWISTAFVFPRKPLPTDYNEACCIGGAFFRVNENGNFCVYDASIENWRVSSTVIPDATWANITVGRNHVAKTCNLWVGSTQVFSNIPISGPDLNEFIRISISSASEYDVMVDLMIGYDLYPF